MHSHRQESSKNSPKKQTEEKRKTQISTQLFKYERNIMKLIIADIHDRSIIN